MISPNYNLKYNKLYNRIVGDCSLRFRLGGLNRKYSKLYGHNVIPSYEFDNVCQQIKDEIALNTHTNFTYTEKTIHDEHSDKDRLLHIPSTKDRIFESVIMQVVEPEFSIKWSRIPYASITDRGLSRAIRRIKNSIGCVSTKKRNFGLKLDIVKYYQSVDHFYMHDAINRYFSNEPILAAVFRSIVDSFSPGLPIGTYSSQFFANLFLANLDFLCTRADNDGRCEVTRYMDDIFVACDDYDKVIEMYNIINGWCNERGLALHDPVIVDFTENNHTKSIKCVGMEFSHQGVFLSEDAKNRMLNRYDEIIQHYCDGCATKTDLGRIASMIGWLSNSTEYKFINDLQLKKWLNLINNDIKGEFYYYDRPWDRPIK